MAQDEQRIEGVEIRPSPHKDWSRNYTEGDLAIALTNAKGDNWDAVIGWLEKNGEDHQRLTPGEVLGMVEDLRKLKQSGAQFTPVPQQVFEMIRQQGGHAQPDQPGKAKETRRKEG